MQDRAIVRAGVAGFGYWGPNLARNIASCERFHLAGIAEPRSGRRAAAARAHPATPLVDSADALITAPDVDLVVLATPPDTHFELAAAALRAGKHVLVEKPFVTDSAQAEELIALADARGLHLLIDHTFLFTGAVRRLREEAPGLGELCYYDATRTNLGTVQAGTDVLWDLAPHDLSILLSLVSRPVELVAAIGARHAVAPGPTMAYVTLRFAGGALAHLHLNWMAPAKVRRTIVGGSRRMLIYDDMEATEKLKIFESASPGGDEGTEDMLLRMVDVRVGDILSPRLDQSEALAVEVEHVARVLLDGEAPISGAALGLRVVRVIEAAQRSLANDGMPLRVEL